jgi:hypothetical protein
MRSKWLFWLTGLMFLLSPLANAEDTDIKIELRTLVMPFETRRDVEPQLANASSQVVLATLSSTKGRQVLGQDDIASFLSIEAERQKSGCADSGCLEEIAGAMDVDTLVTGTVDRVGDRLVLTLTELDAREVKPIARVQGVSLVDAKELLRVADELAIELMQKTSGKVQLFGTLRVQTIPSGVGVYAGNRDLGISPIETEILVGDYEVRVASQDGQWKDALFEVMVERKKITQVDVQLSVPQKVPLAEQEAHQTAWVTHAVLLTAKGCCGFVSWSFASPIGAGFTTWFIGMLSQQMTRQILDLDDPASLLFNPHAQGALISMAGTVVFSTVSFLGIFLMLWSGWDVFHFPEEPVPGIPQHHVKISVADGPASDLVLPAMNSEMAH